MIRFFLIIFAACLTVPAISADWHRAETDHYVVHAELDEDDLREVAQLMESFDRILNQILPPQTERGRKVEFYLQPKSRQIMKLSGLRNEGIDVDFPETAASLATYDISRRPIHWYRSIFSDQASFYFRNAFWRPSPPWAEDGFGGFFGTAYVSDDGAFVLGAPEILSPLRRAVSSSALHRMMTRGQAPDGIRPNARFRGMNQEAMTALLLDNNYAGRLNTYLDDFSSGKSMEEATATIGDLKIMAEKINERRKTSRPDFRQMAPSDVTPANVEIRAMDEDEKALILPRFERYLATDHENIARKLEKLTGKFPDSSLVWFEFAAAEFSRVQSSKFGGEAVFRGFGFSNGELIVSANPYSDTMAWAAVDRSLDLDSGDTQAIRLKAEIMLSRLVRAGEFGDADEYDNVRAMLAPLAETPESQPLAAALYFQSYIEQGIDAPDAAVDLLGKAFVANPGVEEFRYAYAVALSRRGQSDVARSLLTSMLNNPRFSEAAERALEQTP